MRQKIEANVVLCKCPKTRDVFGMRLEKRGGDWLRTWAFKVDEQRARREGFDTETTSGTMTPTPEYRGCPYCGTTGLAQCPCGKVFCWSGETRRLTCPWCGQTGDYQDAERLDVQGGGM
jgi:hypothetical protein